MFRTRVAFELLNANIILGASAILEAGAIENFGHDLVSASRVVNCGAFRAGREEAAKSEFQFHRAQVQVHGDRVAVVMNERARCDRK